MTKAEMYDLLLAQARALFEQEDNYIANLANSTALIKSHLPSSIFAGFYLYDGQDLVLGPFQGGVSCARIALGKGVCGQVAEEGQAMIVADVTKHDNYIACDAAARSEIVLPMVKNGQLLGVLDLDSALLDDYDETDLEGLSALVELLISESHWQ